MNTVLVNVTVTDKAGKPVTDLTIDDFRLYEDGKRQEIQSFELESGRPIVDPEPGNPTSDPAGGQSPRVRSPEDTQGKRTRLISCFIDDLTAHTPRYYAWTISALKKFVAEEMGPQDRVGIFSASGNVRIPFTSDRKGLQDRIDDLVPGKLELPRPLLHKRVWIFDHKANPGGNPRAPGKSGSASSLPAACQGEQVIGPSVRRICSRAGNAMEAGSVD